MEQERDYLDNLIKDSFEDIETEGRFGEQYNKRLLLKLHEEKKTAYNLRTAAISLITAGFLIGFMYTSQVQYRVANLEFIIKTNFSMVKHSINIDKYFLGE